MARHAQPREKAELTGATAKDPQRYTGSPVKNKNPLPDPPRHLSTAAKKIWKEIVAVSLPGVLTESELFHVEQTVELIAEFREIQKHNKSLPRLYKQWEKELDELRALRASCETKTEKREVDRTIRKHMATRPGRQFFPTARIQALTGLLARLGMNPTDRQRISIPDSDGAEDDDFETLH